MKVKNLNGSGEQFPAPVCKCKTWIEHWDINKYPKADYWASRCRGCGKEIKHSELCGGHVIKVNSVDKHRYIVPLCSGCNNTANKEFDVNNSDLISANCDNCINS